MWIQYSLKIARRRLSLPSRMRRLFAFFLILSLLLLPRAFVYAQTAAYAEITAVNPQNFPQISALLGVYDANGEFISGVKRAHLTVYEDGQQHRAGSVTAAPFPVQIAVPINPGPPLA